MKPYNPPPDKPRLAFVFNTPHAADIEIVGFELCYPRGRDPDALATLANAIADDVHGAELAELRQRVREQLEEKLDRGDVLHWYGADIDAIIAALKGTAP